MRAAQGFCAQRWRAAHRLPLGNAEPAPPCYSGAAPARLHSRAVKPVPSQTRVPSLHLLLIAPSRTLGRLRRKPNPRPPSADAPPCARARRRPRLSRCSPGPRVAISWPSPTPRGYFLHKYLPGASGDDRFAARSF